MSCSSQRQVHAAAADMLKPAVETLRVLKLDCTTLMQGGSKESVPDSSRTYKPAQVRMPPSAVTLQVCQH